MAVGGRPTKSAEERFQELEDELEPLYEHGNKMDSGPFGTGMSGGIGC